MESSNTEIPVPAGGSGRLRKLGLALVVLSFILYGGILVVPAGRKPRPTALAGCP
ncbi:MAG: hypothetical protein K6T66_00210 [Peptococcaceae bacterium]|nr:hypothetical protein [Peptococcaceae bacterium]